VISVISVICVIPRDIAYSAAYFAACRGTPQRGTPTADAEVVRVCDSGTDLLGYRVMQLGEKECWERAEGKRGRDPTNQARTC
jgi:hypothetical protein